MDDYKKLIDSTELQKTVLNFIGSEEFNKMVNCSIFKDNQECNLPLFTECRSHQCWSVIVLHFISNLMKKLMKMITDHNAA